MSFFHPVKPRNCKSCNYKWFAESGWTGSRPNPWMHNAGRNVALQHSRSKHEQFKYCPRCGSKKVLTAQEKGFVPTAAQNGW